MIRKPIACPEYYSNAFDQLDKSMSTAFLHEEGPSTLPTKRKSNEVKTILVPSDTFERMGPCAAWAYKEIAEAQFQDAYIILGTNHHATVKRSTYLFSDWETPLGTIKTNKEIGKELIRHYPKILNEHTAHVQEHAIELQLPWLQFASRDILPKLTFIPLAINLKDSNEIKELAEKLVSFIKERKVTIIAASSTGDTPTLQYIRSLDTEGLVNYKKRKAKKIEESAPLLVLIEMAKIQKQKAHIINCQSSFDATKKKENVQHYATITFK